MAVAEDHPRRRATDAAGKAADRARFDPPIPLVEAKLVPPRLAPGSSSGSALSALTAEPAASIVSIVGPPGYGKTLLLAIGQRESRDPWPG